MMLHILANSLTLARKKISLREKNTLSMITSSGPTASLFFKVFFKRMIEAVNFSYL